MAGGGETVSPTKKPKPTPPAPEESLAAALTAATAHLQSGGIGTLKERTLHSTLKFWLEPDVTRHEVPIGGCVADIFDGERVIEIQTGSLYPLQKKLATLLPQVPVTVVVPLPREKWICWIDPATGERDEPHRSPKRGRFLDALPELGWVKEFWEFKGFSVRLLLIDMEEWRLQDGWGRDGKRGSHRADRVPLAVAEEYTLTSLADVAALLPPLPQPFTRKDFAKVLGKRGVAMSRALRFLEEIDLVRRVGKQGNTILYTQAAGK